MTLLTLAKTTFDRLTGRTRIAELERQLDQMSDSAYHWMTTRDATSYDYDLMVQANDLRALAWKWCARAANERAKRLDTSMRCEADRERRKSGLERLRTERDSAHREAFWLRRELDELRSWPVVWLGAPYGHVRDGRKLQKQIEEMAELAWEWCVAATTFKAVAWAEVARLTRELAESKAGVW